ncbi:transglycosylase domain-containing protein [Sphingomonas bacterium]|uniref:transglycosylase domain-containing protein n=1 Tax=Sphingomonas bacterium TaxID=1895847 RepID=UPI002628B837|nr:transglycosylase domain-containing protein [Sphingomonas bacterium]
MPPDALPPTARLRYAYDRAIGSDWPYRAEGGQPDEPAEPLYPALKPKRAARPWLRWVMRALGAGIVLLVIAIIWLAVTAPLSRSLLPPTPPSVTLTAADGTPIARRGAIIGAPVDASKLPDHVTQAFLAIEDRSFQSHWGISLKGIARAAWSNVGAGGVRQGGSTITQQLAKNAFLDSDRTAARKLREVMIAFWLEAWLSKNEILSRYLSNVYFGDNVYGMRAAAKHYFGRTPERLNIGQAAMLAGLVKAPSRLAPTGNLSGARKRQALVVAAMVDADFLTPAQARVVQPQRVLATRPVGLPSGTYFADWVLPEARDAAGEVKSEATVQTTLDIRMQKAAEAAVRRAGLRDAQVAMVAMRPDGRVVAMVGGKDYKKSSFNRATQARRQPGSAFKLFVYLAALRSGMRPSSTVEDAPIDFAGWKPKNDDGRYLGEISLQRAFARSCNVCAARLTQQVGVKAVIKAARDLGISTPIANEATISLGTSTVSLLELTAAYAAVADGRYPVRTHGVAEGREPGWLESFTGRQSRMDPDVEADMKALLDSSLNRGTGMEAALSVPAWGKTGTTQDGRDALFVGWARDLVVGVWVGNDDNTPNPGLHGGGVPARIWRDFMGQALRVQTRAGARAAAAAEEAAAQGENESEPLIPDVGGEIEGLGLNLKLDRDGSISIGPSEDRGPPPEGPPPRDERRAEEELE